MLKNINQIQWFEGMLLSPHHFQYSDLRFNTYIKTLYNAQSYIEYGVIDFAFNTSLIFKGIISLLKFNAIMPNGEIISFDIDNCNDETKSQIPKNLDLNTLNLKVGEEISIGIFIASNNTKEKYNEINLNNIKDINDDDNIVDVITLVPKLIIKTNKDEDSNECGLFLIKIKKQAESFELQDFLAPYINITMNSSIRTKIMDLCKDLRQKYTYLFNKVSDSRIDVNANLMSSLLSALCILEPLCLQKKMSPLYLFENLKHALSFLLIVQFKNIPNNFASFDIDNINDSIMPYLNHLSFCVSNIEQSYTAINFQQQERLFYLKMQEEFNIKDNYIIALQFNTDTSNEKRNYWIENAVIASDQNIQYVTTKRITGAKRSTLSYVEQKDIALTKDLVLIKIAKDDPMIVANQNLNIFNAGDNENLRPIAIFLYLKNIDKDELVATNKLVA